MIYTITTNPSLDYTVEVDLVMGQVNRTKSEVIYPGGKGINVSLALQRLGQETAALGFAAGRIGQTIRDLLDDMGCPHKLLELSGGGQSRINVKFMGEETAVNGMGPNLGEDDMARLLELLRGVDPTDAVVLSGWAQSIPFYVSILQQVVATGCMTVLDCSGEALWQCLGCHPFLVKPNLLELGSLFGVEDLEYHEGVELARQLQHEGARNVLVSMGGNGAFLLTEEQDLYFATACTGTIRNTVGAGDSLVAGFLTGLRQTGDFGEALRMGVAAGSATAFNDWLGTKEETLALMKQVRIEKTRAPGAE
ncbi:MAG: 1-phosphofructokinase family hexose kinase [Oscillospiraceae bacterium]|nr:1-phosphofructokinase family hexose kinase [Oscillospiraceae bacterium]MDE6934274.1 1-phosphofructokinase family hexose kinase [Oscillospiraceae bacterium]